MPENTELDSRDERHARSLALEKAYVHDVYDQIAPHSPESQYRAWPRVKQFLMDLEPGSLVADVGCGNGKYLDINADTFKIGSDRCEPLMQSVRNKKNEVLTCDNLQLPFRDESFDAALSVAVIHHFATTDRRVDALREVARILRIGGKVLITVWAMEQHHRKFDSQDVLVPWHQPVKSSSEDRGSSIEKDLTSTTTSDDDILVYHAYSHVSDTDSNPPNGNRRRQKFRNGKGRHRAGSYEASHANSSRSSSELSSPNETCYSFVRRALQKLSSSATAPYSSQSGSKSYFYQSCRRPWFSESMEFGGSGESSDRISKPDMNRDDSIESDGADDVPIEIRHLEEDDPYVYGSYLHDNEHDNPMCVSCLPIEPDGKKSRSFGDILNIIPRILRARKGDKVPLSDLQKRISTASDPREYVIKSRKNNNRIVRSKSTVSFVSRLEELMALNSIDDKKLIKEKTTSHNIIHEYIECPTGTPVPNISTAEYVAPQNISIDLPCDTSEELNSHTTCKRTKQKEEDSYVETFMPSEKVNPFNEGSEDGYLSSYYSMPELHNIQDCANSRPLVLAQFNLPKRLFENGQCATNTSQSNSGKEKDNSGAIVLDNTTKCDSTCTSNEQEIVELRRVAVKRSLSVGITENAVPLLQVPRRFSASAAQGSLSTALKAFLITKSSSTGSSVKSDTSEESIISVIPRKGNSLQSDTSIDSEESIISIIQRSTSEIEAFVREDGFRNNLSRLGSRSAQASPVTVLSSHTSSTESSPPQSSKGDGRFPGNSSILDQLAERDRLNLVEFVDSRLYGGASPRRSLVKTFSEPKTNRNNILDVIRTHTTTSFCKSHEGCPTPDTDSEKMEESSDSQDNTPSDLENVSTLSPTNAVCVVIQEQQQSNTSPHSKTKMSLSNFMESIEQEDMDDHDTLFLNDLKEVDSSTKVSLNIEKKGIELNSSSNFETENSQDLLSHSFESDNSYQDSDIDLDRSTFSSALTFKHLSNLQKCNDSDIQSKSGNISTVKKEHTSDSALDIFKQVKENILQIINSSQMENDDLSENEYSPHLHISSSSSSVDSLEMNCSKVSMFDDESQKNDCDSEDGNSNMPEKSMADILPISNGPKSCFQVNVNPTKSDSGCTDKDDSSLDKHQVCSPCENNISQNSQVLKEDVVKDNCEINLETKLPLDKFSSTSNPTNIDLVHIEKHSESNYKQKEQNKVTSKNGKDIEDNDSKSKIDISEVVEHATKQNIIKNTSEADIASLNKDNENIIKSEVAVMKVKEISSSSSKDVANDNVNCGNKTMEIKSNKTELKSEFERKIILTNSIMEKKDLASDPLTEASNKIELPIAIKTENGPIKLCKQNEDTINSNLMTVNSFLEAIPAESRHKKDKTKVTNNISLDQCSRSNQIVCPPEVLTCFENSISPDIEIQNNKSIYLEATKTLSNKSICPSNANELSNGIVTFSRFNTELLNGKHAFSEKNLSDNKSLSLDENKFCNRAQKLNYDLYDSKSLDLELLHSNSTVRKQNIEIPLQFSTNTDSEISAIKKIGFNNHSKDVSNNPIIVLEENENLIVDKSDFSNSQNHLSNVQSKSINLNDKQSNGEIVLIEQVKDINTTEPDLLLDTKSQKTRRISGPEVISELHSKDSSNRLHSSKEKCNHEGSKDESAQTSFNKSNSSSNNSLQKELGQEIPKSHSTSPKIDNCNSKVFNSDTVDNENKTTKKQELLNHHITSLDSIENSDDSDSKTESQVPLTENLLLEKSKGTVSEPDIISELHPQNRESQIKIAKRALSSEEEKSNDEDDQGFRRKYCDISWDDSGSDGPYSMTSTDSSSSSSSWRSALNVESVNIIYPLTWLYCEERGSGREKCTNNLSDQQKTGHNFHSTFVDADREAGYQIHEKSEHKHTRTDEKINRPQTSKRCLEMSEGCHSGTTVVPSFPKLGISSSTDRRRKLSIRRQKNFEHEDIHDEIGAPNCNPNFQEEQNKPESNQNEPKEDCQYIPQTYSDHNQDAASTTKQGSVDATFPESTVSSSCSASANYSNEINDRREVFRNSIQQSSEDNDAETDILAAFVETITDLTSVFGGLYTRHETKAEIHNSEACGRSSSFERILTAPRPLEESKQQNSKTSENSSDKSSKRREEQKHSKKRSDIIDDSPENQELESPCNSNTPHQQDENKDIEIHVYDNKEIPPGTCSFDDDDDNRSELGRNTSLSLSTSQESLQGDFGGTIAYHRYYHVFREGELDSLIEKYVENLHIISSYYDHSNWCIIAEKVQVWTI